MQGLHLMADLRGCAGDAALMTDPQALRDLCLAAVQASGLSAVSERFHQFPLPGGVTGVVLLAESHLAVHTWPELGQVALDAYVCNNARDNSAGAEALVQRLIDAFAPAETRRQRSLRG